MPVFVLAVGLTLATMARGRGRGARSRAAVVRGVGAGRHRLPAGPGRGHCRGPPAAPAAPPGHHPRGRGHVQRRDGPRRLQGGHRWRRSRGTSPAGRWRSSSSRRSSSALLVGLALGFVARSCSPASTTATPRRRSPCSCPSSPTSVRSTSTAPACWPCSRSASTCAPSPTTRPPPAGWLLGRAVWAFSDFLITSLVFTLLGFELVAVIRSTGTGAGTMGLAALVVGTLVVFRAVWIYPAAWLARLRARRRDDPRALPAGASPRSSRGRACAVSSPWPRPWRSRASSRRASPCPTATRWSPSRSWPCS